MSELKLIDVLTKKFKYNKNPTVSKINQQWYSQLFNPQTSIYDTNNIDTFDTNAIIQDIIYNTYDTVRFKPIFTYELLEMNTKQIPNDISLFSIVCLNVDIEYIIIFLDFYKHNQNIFAIDYINSPFKVLFNCYEQHENWYIIIYLFKYYIMNYEDYLKNICNDINFLIDLKHVQNKMTQKYIVNYLVKMNLSIFNSNFDITRSQLTQIYYNKIIAKKIICNFDKCEYLFKMRHYGRNTIYEIICNTGFFGQDEWIIKSPYKNKIIEYFPEAEIEHIKSYDIFNESNIKAVE